jgi:hypothetical protein
VCIHTYTHIHIYTYIYTHTYTHIHIHIHIQIQIHMHMHIRRLAPAEHRRELAFILNSLLRSDDGDAAPHLAVIVRAINTLLITRRGDLGMVKFPPNGITYRGGGLPDAHRSFFTAGKKYRVPGFLATSFSQKVAEDFMMYADGRGEPCVLWIVHVHPDGEHSKARRCMHVNFVERSNVQGEDEYLFAPYAPFTVRQASLNVPVHMSMMYACIHSTLLHMAAHVTLTSWRCTRAAPCHAVPCDPPRDLYPYTT